MKRVVEIAGVAGPEEAAAALRAAFPVDGQYVVELFAKATAIPRRPVSPDDEGHEFQEWWLQRLMQAASEHLGGTHDTVWNAVLKFLGDYGGRLTDAETIEQFERLLFDLRAGVRWSMAAPITPDIRVRLRALGFSERQQLDFPGIAYRMGLLERTLSSPGASFTWERVLQAAAELPILPVHEAAINVARQRAATYLAPILTRDGQGVALQAAETERRLVRALTRDAIRAEMHPRALARQFYKQFDNDGLVRDWDRVARTEISNARVRGAFEADRVTRQWNNETLVWRPTAAVPCNACLRLYKNPDGTPRLWKLAELEALDAQGPNTGPSKDWRPRIAATHPNCCCPPFMTHNPALRSVYERDAAKWLAVMRERKLTE